MSDIFLSYVRTDGLAAALIVGALERAGWSVWWDQNTVGGTAFESEIEKELAAARCVIVLWSTESILSDWVRAEAAEARRQGKLIPVLIDDVTMPLQFQPIQAVRLVEVRKATSPDVGKLLDAVAHKLHAPAKEPSVKPPLPRRTPRKKILWAGGIALAVLVGISLLLWFRGCADPSTRGRLALSRGDCSEAARHFARALDEKERLLRDNDDVLPEIERAERQAQAVEVAIGLARAYSCAGSYEQAISSIRRVLKIDPTDPLLLNELGKAYMQVADYSQAGRLFEHALEKTSDTTDRFLLTVSMNLVQARSHEGKLQEAAEVAERTVAREKKALGDEDPDTLDGLLVLGKLRFDLSDYTGAQGIQESLLPISCRVLGPEDDVTMAAKHDLARTLDKLGDNRAALDYFQQVLEVWDRTRDPAHPQVLIARTGLARTLFALGRLDEAKREADRAVSGLTLALGASDPETLGALDLAADIERGRGNYRAERSH